MKSILEELWYGNIDPQVDATRDNKEVKNLLALMMQNREKLCEKLKVPFVPEPSDAANLTKEADVAQSTADLLIEELKGIKEILAKLTSKQ